MGKGKTSSKKYTSYNPNVQVQELQGPARTGNRKAGPVNAPNWARHQ